MHDLLVECRTNLGPVRRQFSWWERFSYLRLPTSPWLTPRDRLSQLFQHQDSIWRDGWVVWGHVVQADVLMYDKGSVNCPGDILYSLEDSERIQPENLSDIGDRVFKLKGTQPRDPQLAPLADHFNTFGDRVFGLIIPPSLSAGFACRLSTTLFVRRHLPKRKLCYPLLPVVVNPKEPYVALPLPARYWPERLIEWWTGF